MMAMLIKQRPKVMKSIRILTVWPWAHHLTSLSLSIVFNDGVIMTLKGYMQSAYNSAEHVLNVLSFKYYFCQALL